MKNNFWQVLLVIAVINTLIATPSFAGAKGQAVRQQNQAARQQTHQQVKGNWQQTHQTNQQLRQQTQF